MFRAPGMLMPHESSVVQDKDGEFESLPSDDNSTTPTLTESPQCDTLINIVFFIFEYLRWHLHIGNFMIFQFGFLWYCLLFFCKNSKIIINKTCRFLLLPIGPSNQLFSIVAKILC